MKIVDKLYDSKATTSPISIKAVTQELFSKHQGGCFDRLMVLCTLRQHWSHIVGCIAAHNSTPIALKEPNILVIQCSTSSWVQELRGLRPRILERLENSISTVDIKDLKIELQRHSVGVIGESRYQKHTPVRRSLTDNEIQRIRDMTLEVDNESLRNTLIRLFSRIAETSR